MNRFQEEAIKVLYYLILGQQGHLMLDGDVLKKRSMKNNLTKVLFETLVLTMHSKNIAGLGPMA